MKLMRSFPLSGNCYRCYGDCSLALRIILSQEGSSRLARPKVCRVTLLSSEGRNVASDGQLGN
jgi:hypothetical protein